LFIFDNNCDGDNDLVIGAFVSLESAGTIVIINNYGLKVFKLEALITVCGYFTVRYNNQLEELSSNVHHVGNLAIENNKSLNMIKFPALKEINQSLFINNNNSLTFLDTFDELKRIGGSIMIADNKLLIEIKGFNKLKYIGAEYATYPVPKDENSDKYKSCACDLDVRFDWCSFTVDACCHVSGEFDICKYDAVGCKCAYILPCDFFICLCNSIKPCGEALIDPIVPSVVSYSILIFGNQKLKAIGGFCNLRHVKSNIYVVCNPSLHTINSFGQLAFVLDVWIRNNKSLKYIIGFSNLLSVRDFIVSDSQCLNDLNSISSLEFAQKIAIEAKTATAVKYSKRPIPSTLGFVLYHKYECD